MRGYVITAILLVLTWLVAWLLDIPLWIPVVLTVIALLTAAVVFGVRRMLATRKSAQIESALLAQASRVGETVRPDLVVEIESMTAEFHKAVAALKSSRLKGGGYTALYALPWYVMIGPPGAGKSTALRNSGLPFPYVPNQSRGSVKGIGGTRNCDWWLTNEAVLLDTAGRWTTQEDVEEWDAFLELLKKHRPKRSLNGILVAVSIEELLMNSDDGRTRLAAKIRERIDELMSRLGIALPVYAVVTKCDLLPGFVETFGPLPRSERGQLWGYTLPFRDLGLELPGIIETRFGELRAGVEQRALLAMGQEQRIDARELIAGFPGQFALVQEPLTHFLIELFQANVYRQSPLLRGTYFTSGTQEGTPIDRLLGQLAETAGMPANVAVPEPVLERKSYFLNKVFFDVLFPDAKLAAPTEKVARRRQIVEVSAGLALTLLAGLAILVSAVSWHLNRELVDSTSELVRGVAAFAKTGEQARPLSPAPLESLRARADELRTHQAEGAPLWMRLGLYSGQALGHRTTSAYAEAMRDRVIGPLLRADSRPLDDWAERFERELELEPSPEEYDQHYTSLAHHLRLTNPRAADEPEMTDAERARLVDTLASLWSQENPESRHVDSGVLALQILLFLRLSDENPALRLPRDERMVRRARVGLSRLPASRVALAELIREAEGRGYELTLSRMIGSTGTALRATEHVRGAFTKRAWVERIRQRIEDAGARRAGTAWVLGPLSGDAAERRRAMRDELRNQYFAAYVEEWQRFIRSIRVTNAGDGTLALALLEDLTRGNPPPLGRLFVAIDENTRLPDFAPSAGEGVASGLLTTIEERVRARVTGEVANAALDVALADAPPPTAPLTGESIRAAFSGLVQFGVAEPASEGAPPPTGLDIYQEQLSFLRDALSLHRDDPSSNEQVMARLQATRTRVQSLISEQPVGWRPFFESLLWPPVDGAATTSSRAMAGSTARSWCSSVAVPFFTTLAGRYPFESSGHDAAVADFAAFYRPQSGTVWSFYGQALSGQVERDGANFVFATRLGRGAGSIYRSTLPLFLERSQAISTAFFPPGGSEPRVEMDVRVHPVPGAASVRFASGGTVIDYRNGPETWTRVVWPGEHPDQGASIEVLGAGGLEERIRQEGEWGLFRLMERATRVSGGGPSARTFVVTWTLAGHGLEMSVSVRLVRAENPFFAADDRRGRMLGPLRAIGVQAPRVIATEGECHVGS